MDFFSGVALFKPNYFSGDFTRFPFAGVMTAVCASRIPITQCSTCGNHSPPFQWRNNHSSPQHIQNLIGLSVSVSMSVCISHICLYFGICWHMEIINSYIWPFVLSGLSWHCVVSVTKTLYYPPRSRKKTLNPAFW